MGYKFIQLTNPVTAPFGAVATGELIPLGTVTARYMCGGCRQPTFAVSTSGADTITLNDCGTYKVTFNASVVAAAAGLVTVNLVQNGVIVATASETATAAGDTVNLSFTYILRNFPTFVNGFSNFATTLQVVNAGVALTSGTSNLIVEQIH